MIHDPLEKFLTVNEFPEKKWDRQGWEQKETHFSSIQVDQKSSFFSLLQKCSRQYYFPIPHQGKIKIFENNMKDAYESLYYKYKAIQRSLMISDLIWDAKDPVLSPWYALCTGMTVWSHVSPVTVLTSKLI